MKYLLAIGAALLAFLGWKNQAKQTINKVSPPGEMIVDETNYGYEIPGYEPPPVTLDDLYQSHGRQHGLDPMLLKAIAIVESSENPNAKNPADPSIGLMQILCVPDGNGSCSNKLNIQGWPPADARLLYDPDYSLYLGGQILKWNISTYGFKKGIAVYNSWGARLDPDDGPFRNQNYVDKVLNNYYGLTGTSGNQSSGGQWT
jgi:soluble lytic murein transglycosylase-like protein